MAEWIAIEDWQRCIDMARPGIVFEIRNKAGQSLLTPCVTPMPAPAFDWQSPPVEFRAVPEEPPRHSDPLPPPKG